ncbi:MAG TPA: CocE/NonD family hydrolase C-terminal non-catalytic domain-containing protein, partial [Candidatus Thermoplasmatota archaeon]|nr:CocE/NonD family hydrolase C-terminal non-catalytic domain-containing protein [Candidatus Thermoplasmatota archaeon]
QQDSVYTDFYAVRNFSARAHQVQASMLYTQGFEDGNVKPWQLMHFFDAVPSPKKGLFGAWGHHFPPRSDYRDFELAWFDFWLKGIDTGVMEGPTAEVLTNLGTWRGDTTFPPKGLPATSLHLDATDRSLRLEAPAEAGKASFVADRRPRLGLGALEDALRGSAAADERLVFTSAPLRSDLHVSGVMDLWFNATLDGPNAYLMATLFEVRGGERKEVAFGGLAAALRDGYTEYKPVPQGEMLEYRLRFQPHEWVLQEGSHLELHFGTVDVVSATTTEALDPVRVTFHTGPGAGSRLALPTQPADADQPAPWK